MFAMFDRHLVAFLRQAGCDAELVRLADHGVHGNGHGMMLERNNEQALAVITAGSPRTRGSSRWCAFGASGSSRRPR